MMEFLRGWRRKIGCIMLLMACLVMAGWVRSLTVNDQFDVPCNGEKEHYFFHSVNGVICSTHLNQMNQSWSLLKQDTVKWDSNQAEPLSEDFENSFDWQLRWLGFGFGKLKPGAIGTATMTFWSIPYWSITIPLTLISLWLLLKKPKTSTSKKITEPTTSEGGGAAT